jgi:hypothetical protein
VVAGRAARDATRSLAPQLNVADDCDLDSNASSLVAIHL